MSAAIRAAPASTADLEADERRTGDHVVALERELPEIDRQIDEAASRSDFGAVVKMQLRRRERERVLPRELAAARAAYDERRQASFDARKQEERVKVARELEQVRDRRRVQERAIELVVTSMMESGHAWAVTVRRESELEGQLRERPAADAIDAIRAPLLQFLDHAFQRLFDWLWVEHRPATVNLDGPAGEAERVVYKALFGGD